MVDVPLAWQLSRPWIYPNGRRAGRRSQPAAAGRSGQSSPRPDPDPRPSPRSSWTRSSARPACSRRTRPQSSRRSAADQRRPAGWRRPGIWWTSSATRSPRCGSCCDLFEKVVGRGSGSTCCRRSGADPDAQGAARHRGAQRQLQRLVQKKLWGVDVRRCPAGGVRPESTDDKVIQTRNNYDLGVMNGAMGIVHGGQARRRRCH